MTSNRKAFAFVFTATIAGVLLVIFGLIGYTPPAHMSLNAETWRLGTWTDGVILAEVVLGCVLLGAAVLVGLRLIRKALAQNEQFVKTRLLDPSKPSGLRKDFFTPNVVAEFDRYYTKKAGV